TIGESKVWITTDRFVEKGDCDVPILTGNRSTSRSQGRARAEIKIVSLQVLGWLFPNFGLFAAGKSDFELRCDRLRELTLERENVVQLAIVLLRTNLRGGPGVDKLDVHANAIAGYLDDSLKHIRHRQIAPDLLDI